MINFLLKNSTLLQIQSNPAIHVCTNIYLLRMYLFYFSFRQLFLKKKSK